MIVAKSWHKKLRVLTKMRKVSEELEALCSWPLQKKKLNRLTQSFLPRQYQQVIGVFGKSILLNDVKM